MIAFIVPGRHHEDLILHITLALAVCLNKYKIKLNAKHHLTPKGTAINYVQCWLENKMNSLFPTHDQTTHYQCASVYEHGSAHLKSFELAKDKCP